MAEQRRVEIFSAGCSICEDTVGLVRRLAYDSCEIVVLDMGDAAVADRARRLGVRSIPAIAVDGRLADCCAGRGPDEAALRSVGIDRSPG